MHRARAGRLSFPPLARARVENLACSPPVEQGLKLSHWSVRALQTVAIRLSLAPTLHYTTIAGILRRATLQPHRWRYWKTTVWDAAAIRQAAKVLWGYEHVTWLLERGILVVCVDEKPNLQVLERAGPIRPMLPGQIEQQEFEYIRHGTVHLLVGLTLHEGHMWAECLEANDGAHFRPALLRYLDGLRDYVGVYLIMDNGASHIATETRTLVQGLKAPWVRACYTPAHASWLNQAELLLGAFSGRYLERGSWDSRPAMIEHIGASYLEYNQLFAHPFQWSWTRLDFQQWVKKKRDQISCNTSATGH
jgi:hypothetical protein